MALFHRKDIATILLVLLLGFGAPSLGIAGGCDEPGYTGGSCNKAENQGNSGGSAGGEEDPGIADEPGVPGSDGGGGAGQVLPTISGESAATVVGMLTRSASALLTYLFTRPVR